MKDDNGRKQTEVGLSTAQNEVDPRPTQDDIVFPDVVRMLLSTGTAEFGENEREDLVEGGRRSPLSRESATFNLKPGAVPSRRSSRRHRLSQRQWQSLRDIGAELEISR
ncbi:unnamed protein product [Phytophthora fragariaefolia]|uniref:Unnamed protein product n=1 Tax=Phytophthora fragariaefolia TaxID=1490495 RepID=A0A9W6X9L5_9STRA|nr:unnamed protein product [Phytophthora fragariaefolia]